MIANTYYEKALANFKIAKIVYSVASNDEEQLNIAGYHIQQALELAIKHIFVINGMVIMKTHDIDQLIRQANENNIDLMLPEYIIEQSEAISNWESKTRYILGYALEIHKIDKALQALDEYFTTLASVLSY